MSTNPYAAPRSAVADIQTPIDDGDFIPEGQSVGIGNGWTWITESWGLFRKAPGMWIGCLIAIFAMMIVLALIPIAGTFAMMLLYPVWGAGLMVACHALWNEEPMEFSHIFAGFKHRFGALLALGAIGMVSGIAIAVIMAAVMGVGIGTFLGTAPPPTDMDMSRFAIAYLVALGLSLPLYMAVWFAPALIMINDFGAIQAVKTSFMGCLKNILPFLLYSIVFFVILVISAIPLALGLLITMPMFVASIYTAYRDIYYAA
ncbi:MAG TPA: BPSS1780 family membrane protein [Burkholderiales bacterium]|nr:BPSS1780 family membrane protein [Burkholderiales bacterium]